MRTSRSTLVAKVIASVATAALLAGCGGSDDPSDSAESDSPTSGASSASEPTTSSSTSDPTDDVSDDTTDDPSDDPSDDPGKGNGDESTVDRGSFCAELDPATVGDTLGLEDVKVISDVEPGDEIQTDPTTAGTESKEWTCVIGETGGRSVAATWTIRDGKAGSNGPNARMKTLRGSLGAKNCEGVSDKALGEDTEGVDCSRAATGSGSTDIGFTLVARAAVIDGTQVECYLASTDPADLPGFTEAAPDICAMFLGVVVE